MSQIPVETLLLLIAAAILLFWAFVFGIAGLLLRGKPRSIIRTAWIVVSCMFYGVYFYANGEAKNNSSGPYMDQKLSIVQLELAGVIFQNFEQQKHPDFSIFSQIIGDSEIAKQQLKLCEKNILEVLETNPESDQANGLLAWTIDQSGGDPCKSDPDEIHTSRSGRRMQLKVAVLNVLCPDRVLTEKEIKQTSETINKRFKRFLLRTSALSMLAKNTKNAELYNELSSSLQVRLNELSQNLHSIIISRILLSALGGINLLFLIIKYRASLFKLVASESPLPQFTLKRIMAVVLIPAWLSVVVAVVGSVAYYMFRPPSKYAVEGNALLGALAHGTFALATIVCIYLLVIRKQTVLSWSLFGVKEHGKDFGRQMSFGVQGWLISQFLASLVAAVTALLSGGAPTTNNSFTMGLLASATELDVAGWTAYFLMATVFAPVIEELIFRGLIYTWLKRKFGMTAALLVSSLAFAAAHTDPGQFMSIFACGLVLGIIYERSGTIFASMLTHALINLTFIVTFMALNISGY